jgi:GNAT superfamily N-acetyltransferase
MSDLVFRDAARADLAAIIELLADDFLGSSRGEVFTEPLPQAYVEAFEAIAADPRGHLIVAERAGAVIGCYQLTLIPGLSYGGAWKAIIEGVRISASLRGCGLGARLMADAIGRARQGGARTLELSTNKARRDAQRFYAKLGFKNAHEGFKLELS